ncbi:3-ketosteroid reductase [Cordyceps fumosorosea ARSEF 2679]|uniref:3-ketosteroid reductase n=1 Tax=Cordyceps fumosorosea (strain ARSEF 2679) TaxID=1081104 RepID=A0A168BMK3_CORFA|nr:3-ketosteroid reductase [Cordyceps fumosorosea ARSEF 2679]OAA70313.1 3-ketosteroid reductase [Cordyceps fumosorosea ARSEF 2679]
MVSAVPVTRPAPWEKVPDHDQLFILITGANSGIGLGIAQRLIDEFLATRPPTAHLVLIPTTRSARKSLETIRTLRAYAEAAARALESVLRRRRGPGVPIPAEHRWQDIVARIHVLSLALDLCDLRGLYAFADALCDGTVSNPPGLEGEYLTDVRVPRLDSVVYNAAYGGWEGVNWVGAVKSFFGKGLIETATYPDFKNALPTCILNERESYPPPFGGRSGPEKPLLGEVFAACTFGHYCLTHKLRPLLSRPRDSSLAPGRVIWSSSIEAHCNTFSVDDLQCFTRAAAYESAKRLTDILCLTSTLPHVRPHTRALVGASRAGPRSSTHSSDSDTDVDSSDSPDDLVGPRMYLSHPGIVASTLFPLPAFLFWLYQFALVLCRWCGSPWHTGNGYRGALAPVWLATRPQPALDELAAERVKWGSARDRGGQSFVKPTEVEGWGWRGEVEDPDAEEQEEYDGSPAAMRNSCGRRRGAVAATQEDIAEFEALGAECWREMERLRRQWEDILELE